MRLIDAYALIADIGSDMDDDDTTKILGRKYLSYDKLFGYIERARTVDAVEVVRCKDCKEYEPYDDLEGHGACKWHSNYTKHDEDFCSVPVYWTEVYPPNEIEEV